MHFSQGMVDPPCYTACELTGIHKIHLKSRETSVLLIVTLQGSCDTQLFISPQYIPEYLDSNTQVTSQRTGR